MNIENFLMESEENAPVAGYELAIAPQLNDGVVDAMKDIYTSMKANVGKKKIMSGLKKDLSNLILERFGILTNVMEGPFACFPDIVKNDALFPEWMNEAFFNHDIKNKNIVNDFNIEIDYKAGKIYGMEKKSHILQIDMNVIKGDFSSEELTAVTLHEIGHLFTFIETSTRLIGNTTHLLESVQEIGLGNVDKAKKKLDNDFDVKIDGETGIKKLANQYKRDVEVLSTLSNNTKDSEIIADAFVSKFGLSDSLASSVKKLTPGYFSLSGLLWINVVAFLLIVLVTVLYSGGWVLLAFGLEGIFLLLFSTILIATTQILTLLLTLIFLTPLNILSNKYSTYDLLVERIEKMKRNDIAILRKNKLPKQTKENILLSIEKIEKMVSDMKKVGGDNFLQFVLGFGVTGKSVDLESIRIEAINKLQNNDLHYLAEKAIAGNESLSDILDKDKIVVEKQYINIKKLNDKLPIDDKSLLLKLNKVLKDFESYVEVTKDKKELAFYSKGRLYINYGISSIGLVFTDKKDIVFLTKDVLKISWFKKVFPDFVVRDSVTDEKDSKNIYICTVPKVLVISTIVDDEKLKAKYKKQIDKLNKFYTVKKSVEKDYGDSSYINNIHLLIDACDGKNIDKEIIDQLHLIDNIYNRTVNGVNLNGWLDLHYNNIGINGKGEIVFIDPVYSNSINAKKIMLDA